jgi:hypothetical protein
MVRIYFYQQRQLECALCRVQAFFSPQNRKSALFFWLVRQSQIRKFIWCASPLIANPQIFYNRTFLWKKGWNTSSFKQLSPFSTLSWQNDLKFGCRFVRLNLNLSLLSQYFVGKTCICESFNSAKNWVRKSQICKLQKILGQPIAPFAEGPLI